MKAKIIFYNLLISLTLLPALTMPAVVLASSQSAERMAVESAFNRARRNLSNVGKETGFGEAKKDDTGIYTTLALIINIILGLVGIVATIYLIHAGVKWMRAAGNEEDIKEAKQEIRGALIGLMIIFSAYVVVNFIVERLIQAVTK